MRKVIKKAACMLMACTIMLTPAVSVQAATGNVTDTSFSGTTSFTVNPREKRTSTKVYVYITKAPTKYINVQVLGNRNTASSWYNETKGTTAKVTKGVKSSITNYAYENRGANNTYVLVKLKVSTADSGTISGVWSPDSTQNYTVVN